MAGYPQFPQYPAGQNPSGQAPAGYGQQPAKNPFADGAPPNPYLAPQPAMYAAPTTPAPPPGKYPGLWREGSILVMHKLAPLPDICLLSNQPAERRLQKKLQWHHPALALTIFLGLLVYVILAIILTKRATIQMPLTQEWYERRQRRLIFAWGTGLACIALMVLGIVLTAQTEHPEYLLLLLAGFIGGLITLIAGQALIGLVAPKRITDDYVWLKGVSPEFLNRLEVWPYRI
jgi:hypothetical protein